jgi:hypothetical protein
VPRKVEQRPDGEDDKSCPNRRRCRIGARYRSPNRSEQQGQERQSYDAGACGDLQVLVVSET